MNVISRRLFYQLKINPAKKVYSIFLSSSLREATYIWQQCTPNLPLPPLHVSNLLLRPLITAEGMCMEADTVHVCMLWGRTVLGGGEAQRGPGICARAQAWRQAGEAATRRHLPLIHSKCRRFNPSLDPKLNLVVCYSQHWPESALGAKLWI